jgi:ABC-type Mn2+/Zn2+ transport system permease subunit
VIAEFQASWALFHHAWVVGWLLAVVLATIGVLVVARDQIFIGAAVSQASVLGIAIVLRAGPPLAALGLTGADSEGFQSVMAVVASALAALVTTRAGDDGRTTHEALTGWVYLLGASAAILVVAHSPHGLEEVHRVLSSSIIGASAGDVWLFAGLTAATLGAVTLWTRELVLVAIDPVMAAAVGMRVRLWSAGVSLWLGLLVGLAINLAGVIYAFGCLVLPGLVARQWCREVRQMFVVAPLVGLAAAFAGFVTANHWDYPPAQMTVALLCASLAVGALGARPPRD